MPNRLKMAEQLDASVRSKSEDFLLDQGVREVLIEDDVKDEHVVGLLFDQIF